jgi:hypothetical protein
MSSGVNSSSGGSLPRVFSLEKETDKLALLRLVHRSPLTAEEKNSIRDAVFESARSSDPTQRAMLQKALEGIGVSLVSAPERNEERPVPPPRTEKEKAVSSFGRRRAAPRFAALASVTEVKRTPEEHAHMPSPQDDTAVAPRPEPVPPPDEVGSLQTELPELSARISEIKQQVNAKIGNPVNLMDRDAEKGREYMSALLDAMKKSSGGAPEEVASARQRLEKAYADIVPLLQENPSVAAVPKVKAAPETKPAVSTAPVPKPASPAADPKPMTAPAAPLAPEPERPRMPSVKQNLSGTAASRQQEKTSTPAAQLQMKDGETAMHSVAKEKQLQDLLRAKREEEMTSKKQQEEARIAAMDPLQTPEVSQGLAQLLSEWSLFKSSGFLGTGPSGLEHPLYKRIAQLTMAAVIAGRFEGATPQVKQNIADYMNGWRYEEGILHEHTETFEQYLRRVIKHILQRQKRK